MEKIQRVERILYPFAALVGQESMKLALILNAINTQVGGVLIRGEKGTGKSTAVRALAEILPKIDVVKRCPFNCNPHIFTELCPYCKEKVLNNKLKTEGSKNGMERRKVRVVDLPLGS